MKNKIIIFLRKYYYLLSVLLIFFSFPTYDVWLFRGLSFFAWISLVPLFVYIRDKSFKEAMISSFIAGVIGNLLVYSWIGDFGAGMAGGYILILAVLMPSLAAFMLIKILIAEFFSRRFERYRIFIYPASWIFVDWIQSIGFLAFPWTYWGYSQYKFVPFMQISSYTGIMGITFILILANSIFSDLVFNYNNNRTSMRALVNSMMLKKLLLFMAFVFLVTLYGQYTITKNNMPEKRDMRIALVQSCISPWENWRENRFLYLQDLEDLTSLALKHDPDLIIWSESATLENISYDSQWGNLNPFERSVLEIARKSNRPLLTGEIGIKEDVINNRYYPQNNAVLIDEKGKVTDTYAKINLVPFGEWFPYMRWFPFLKEILTKFGASNFVPGQDPMMFKTANRNFGVLICYEGIFFRLCRKYRNMGSEFLINITNLGWTKSWGGHLQQFAASRFRAVENGIWFISATNTGYTAVVDPYGKITGHISRLEKNYMISDINFESNHKTFYSRYGDLILYLAAVFLFVLGLISLYRFALQSYHRENE